MTASCFSTPLPVAHALPVAHGLQRPSLYLPGRTRVCVRGLVLPAVLGLVLGAALLAPEQPRAQAEICQRHNGVAACRIW
jgi:hypothetical protein